MSELVDSYNTGSTGANAPTRVMAIGLDSANYDLVMKWSDAGLLPNLAKLRDRGGWGRLIGPEGTADDGTWATFSTCQQPNDHGRVHHKGIRSGEYETRPIRAQYFEHPGFWQAIDAAGKRVVIADIPKSPHSPLSDRGIALYDWRVHGVDGRPSSQPSELAAELDEEFGADLTDRPDSREFFCHYPSILGERPQLIEKLHITMAQKRVVAKRLAQRRSDLFLAVFKESHCAGHHCWPPNDDLLGIYRGLDETVGELLEFADENTTVIVFSNLSMGENYHASHLLDKIARRLEKTWQSEWRDWRTELDIFYHRVRRRLGYPAKTSAHRYRLVWQIEHNEIAGALRINLQEREPCGRVSQAQYKSRCDELEAELMALVDPATGHHVVEKVLRVDQQTGQRRNNLPDLLVIWSRQQPIQSLYSPTVGHVRGHPGHRRNANHLRGGFYLAAGPFVQPGESTQLADVADLGVTMAALLGVQLKGVSGRTITAILPSDVQAHADAG